MGIILGDLVATSDGEVDAAVSDKDRDVGRRQEDERHGQVLDQRNVEARFAPELDIATGEKLESGLLEAALWGTGVLVEGLV